MNTSTITRPPRLIVVQQFTATVLTCRPDGTFMIESDNGTLCAQRAASCLMLPMEGDQVVMLRHGHQLWVVAILVRAFPQAPTHLCVEGDVILETLGGSLSFKSPDTLSFESNEVHLTTNHSKCKIQHMDYSGDIFTGVIQRVSILGNQCHAVWQILHQSCRMLFRKVRQTEHSRVGQLDYEAEHYARIHAQHTFITAEKVAKVDAEQIHIG